MLHDEVLHQEMASAMSDRLLTTKQSKVISFTRGASRRTRSNGAEWYSDVCPSSTVENRAVARVRRFALGGFDMGLINTRSVFVRIRYLK